MSNIQQLVQKLKSEGKTDVEISTTIDSLAKMAFVRQIDVLTKFFDERKDLPEITDLEKIADIKEREEKMNEYLQKNYGKSMNEIANEMLEQVVGEYLVEANKHVSS